MPLKISGPGGCGCGTTGPPPANIPGCACTAIPAGLSMTNTGPCVEGTFPPCSINYGPTPPELSGLDLGANCFLSDEVFVDSFSGQPYRFHVGCDTIFIRLSRVFLPTETGDAFHDGSIYSWSIGQTGNTCAPFLMSSGYIYPGGNPNCKVILTES